MSRGSLSTEILSDLAKELPDLKDLWDTVPPLSPGFIPMGLPPESAIPIAAACLEDKK